MLFRESLPEFKNAVLRSKAALWFKAWDVVIPRHQNVLAVLRSPGQLPVLIPASNIVTDAGDFHYAQRAVS